MTYTLPEPTYLYCDAWFHSDEQIQTALHEAYVAGQRDMREAAAQIAEFQTVEFDATTWAEVAAAAIRALPIETI